MTKFLVVCIAFFVTACGDGSVKSDVRSFTGDDAHWIGDGVVMPDNDSLHYLDDPAPLFRKEFVAKKNVSSATLFITAAGYYKATINGARVGVDLFEPAWTDYGKRVFYAEHDITAMLKEGNNSIGVTLGNGFYNPLPLRMWGRRNLREELTIGRPVFIAKLLVHYDDGTTQEMVTDESWKYSYGPIIRNNVFLGEVYDARKEIIGWDLPGFDDQNWKPVSMSDGPGGELQKAFFPSMQITQRITPVQIYACPSNKANYIVDMGVNFTGTYKIKMSGNTGDTIIFRLGERIYEDGTLNPMTAVVGQIKRAGVGGPGAPAIAWQTDSYVFGENKDAWYSPEFTYHTFRYLEVSGLKMMPEVSDIEGLFIHNNVVANNHFSCSAELLNSILDMSERTFLANLVSVQTDCPAREKFGYGGDLNAISESYIYSFDMQDFYRKTIYDWVDAMNDSVFVDTAPYVGIRYCGISWESAYLTTQYFLYLYYNDTEIIEELYDLNNQWMDKVARIHPEKIVDKGLSDHESLLPVPVQLIGTTHYLKSARIMQQFASVMNDQENEKKYRLLAEELQDLVKSKFWDKFVEGPINRQTLFASLLYYDIIPDNELDAAKDSLIQAVKNGPSGHFNTGIFGTKYILESLSKNHEVDLVYDIVNSTTYPGWGHMIDRGATTIWETWKESDNTYSNCHPMFGTVTEWFYRWLGGIRPDPENPGFKEFFLTPATPPGLQYVNTEYHSPFGKIVSNWNKESSGGCRYEMVVPPGSVAHVVLSVKGSQKIVIEKLSDDKFDPGKIGGLQSGRFDLPQGEYVILVTSDT